MQLVKIMNYEKTKAIIDDSNYNKLGLSWAKLSQAGVKPGVGINQLL